LLLSSPVAFLCFRVIPLFTINLEDVIGMVAILELSRKFFKFYCWGLASDDPGDKMLLTVILIETEPHTIETTERLPKSMLAAFEMAERKAK
jgi:hypothetical protein